jgi:hypothetical protein
VVGSTGVFSGNVVGSTASGATNTLELGGSGSLTDTGTAGTVTANASSWSFSNFGTVAIDAIATWTLTGSDHMAYLTNNGTLTVAGTLVASTVDPASTGLFQIGIGASFEAGSATGGNDRINFLGSDKLIVDNVSLFGTNIGSTAYSGALLQNFIAGETIDLKGLSATSLALNYDPTSGLLQMANGSAKATLEFENASLGSGSFHAASDGGTGTFITHA